MDDGATVGLPSAELKGLEADVVVDEFGADLI